MSLKFLRISFSAFFVFVKIKLSPCLIPPIFKSSSLLWIVSPLISTSSMLKNTVNDKIKNVVIKIMLKRM